MSQPLIEPSAVTLLCLKYQSNLMICVCVLLLLMIELLLSAGVSVINYAGLIIIIEY